MRCPDLSRNFSQFSQDTAGDAETIRFPGKTAWANQGSAPFMPDLRGCYAACRVLSRPRKATVCTGSRFIQRGDGRNGLNIVVQAPERMPPLPAAVEVAAYRIAQEAVTNVVRHAGAHTCSVGLTLNGMLALEVCDDGRGLPPERRSGVGIRSMQERAAELGGICVVEPAPTGGTRVLARLPVRQA